MRKTGLLLWLGATLALLATGTAWSQDGILLDPATLPRREIVIEAAPAADVVINCKEPITPGGEDLTIWGFLNPISEGSGWSVVEQGSCRQYVLLGVERFDYNSWFLPGTEVKINARRPDIAPNRYATGMSVHIEEIWPIW